MSRQVAPDLDRARRVARSLCDAFKDAERGAFGHGIYWKLLPPEKIEAIPAIRRMAAHLPNLG